MAKGQSKKRSTWDRCVELLKEEGCIFRLKKHSKSDIIQIRQIENGKSVREFSSHTYRVDSDEDIENLTELCRRASRAGTWTLGAGGSVSVVKTWADLADVVRTELRKRVAREGSRKNTEGHLKSIAKLRGEVTANGLESWAFERDPVTQPAAFRNRMETLSHIHRTKLKGIPVIDLTKAIARLKAAKPSGAVKKEHKRRAEEVKCIPGDASLQRWLDQLDGVEQWTLALIATYGLRPSEAWHAEKINEEGWLVIPGEGLTKTCRHIAPPVPSAWVDRYGLEENFDRYKRELNARWRIRWEDRDGLSVPVNNSQVSNSLYKRIESDSIPRLYDDQGRWCRPYDLRHSYAIRCFTSEETRADSSEDFAKWMGHSLDVHERVYLRFMSATREDEALMAKRAKRASEAPSKESPTTKVELPEDVQAQLEELKRIKQAMGLTT